MVVLIPSLWITLKVLWMLIFSKNNVQFEHRVDMSQDQSHIVSSHAQSNSGQQMIAIAMDASRSDSLAGKEVAAVIMPGDQIPSQVAIEMKMTSCAYKIMDG
ncbi:hypothetical protein O6H91_07G047800 [Diphasiastrum complanatum]|uniref:Uncharacterized protein n=1 Tax=Diphasiastrum complanatum TaxID=34168 RepID=A0ACC2D4X4_DIPCM|nr:hypothetical protein O6H91_07G047800 [Diphasiastrum complanatum]